MNFETLVLFEINTHIQFFEGILTPRIGLY